MYLGHSDSPKSFKLCKFKYATSVNVWDNMASLQWWFHQQRSDGSDISDWLKCQNCESQKLSRTHRTKFALVAKSRPEIQQFIDLNEYSGHNWTNKGIASFNSRFVLDQTKALGQNCALMVLTLKYCSSEWLNGRPRAYVPRADRFSQ